MRIAVNAIFLQKDKLEGYGHYAKEILSRMVVNHPEHEFIFVFDRPFDPSFLFAGNITPIIVKPAARHALAYLYWYNIAAPLALKKYKPDCWWQPYGFCSLTTGIPQLMVIHDLAYLHHPGFIAWHHRIFYQLFTAKFIKKANSLVTVSEFSKADMVKQFKIAVNKIEVISGAARADFQPIGWQEKEAVKAMHTQGSEYFLFTGGIHPRKNLLNLLKAFSKFKKWQQSNMKLLVAGRLAWKYDSLVEKLKSYKYREDVVMLGYLSDKELQEITASAYALVYPSFFEGFGLPVMEAMQSGVPVICSDTSSMPEIAADAALYASPIEPDTIAKQMLNLYKNESLRDEMIRKGLERAKDFNWDKAAQNMWDQLMTTTKK